MKINATDDNPEAKLIQDVAGNKTTANDFAYSNINPRGMGPFWNTTSRLFKGVAAVQAQVQPYAEAWQRANHQAYNAQGPLWVVLGDSMAQGVGASAFNKGWVGQLQQLLEKDGHHFRLINLSFSGARVDDVLEYQLPAMRKLHRPALVTVLIGANNLVRSQYRLALPKDFETMLQQLPNESVIGNITGTSRAAERTNAILQWYAQPHHFQIVNMNRAFEQPLRPRLSSDRFHPNDLGYRPVAAAFERAVQERL